MKAAKDLHTLQQAILYFADAEECLTHLAARRPEWKNGVVCPTCGSSKVSFLKNQLRWQCSSHHAKRQFSLKVGTIFEDSPLDLSTWLSFVWLITNAKRRISNAEMGHLLGVTRQTAWLMLRRVRLAHQVARTPAKWAANWEL
jgi:transposase-like protein